MGGQGLEGRERLLSWGTSETAWCCARFCRRRVSMSMSMSMFAPPLCVSPRQTLRVCRARQTLRLRCPRSSRNCGRRHYALTFSRTSRNVAHAKRRHVVRRVRPRARQASRGRARELSGSEAAGHISCNVPGGVQLSHRQAGEDRQPVCRRCCDVRIGSSTVQVGALARSVDHPIATGRCQLIKHVARRPSTAA